MSIKFLKECPSGCYYFPTGLMKSAEAIETSKDIIIRSTINMTGKYHPLALKKAGWIELLIGPASKADLFNKMSIAGTNEYLIIMDHALRSRRVFARNAEHREEFISHLKNIRVLR